MMMVAITQMILSMAILSSVHGDRVWFGNNNTVGASSQQQIIAQNYESHNIFIVNGTTVTLDGYTITAPSKNDDGEDAVRVEDATFIAKDGIIWGGLGVGGSGVTVSTTRNSDYPPGVATFDAGMEVYGGDATRERTSKGGDAVQILQSGSVATFNGGRFVPGTGCTVKVCGVATDTGNAIQIIQGKAIVKGGTFEGNFNNLQGDIEIHGCVEYDEETEKITGTLLDGVDIDVLYTQPDGQNQPPAIVYNSEVCRVQERDDVTPPKEPSSGGWHVMNKGVHWHVSLTSFVLGFIVKKSFQ